MSTDAVTPQVPENNEIDPAEIARRIIYNNGCLEWKNFCNEQPEKDRRVIVFCNLGNLTENLYITHQDNGNNWRNLATGVQYPVRAWAYLDNPMISPENLKKITEELKLESASTKPEVA